MPFSCSVVVANYNHGRYLGGALEAILSQSVRPREVIVIDDASTDDSALQVQEISRRDPIVRLVRHTRNLGVLAAVNRGLAEARGVWFYSGAADDYVLPGFLDAAFRMAQRHPKTGVILALTKGIDVSGKYLKADKVRAWTKETCASPDQVRYDYLEREYPLHSLGCGTIYRRDALSEIGGFPAEVMSWSDTFTMRAVALKYGACYLPEELVCHRVSDSSFSAGTGRDIRKMLDLVARAAWLMRSKDFKDRFPEEYVHQWERKARRYVHDQRENEVRSSYRKWGRGWVRRVDPWTAFSLANRCSRIIERIFDCAGRFQGRLATTRWKQYSGDISCFNRGEEK